MSDAPSGLAAALVGRYRIERALGAGGMATVYVAEDLKHDRKVAIKVLRPELAAVLGAERFVQEIKTTAQLQHPHILPLFDSGEAGGFLYYVMPYIEGETIRDRLNRETQLGVEEAVRITTEVADALDYAHRQGVIHRDIKPENVLLHDGRAMVMDFGIALAVSAAAGGRMTETGLSLGTPHYMSPEQATADKVITARSDVYSLASVLYEMLAGLPPHSGGSMQQIIMKVVTDEVAPVVRMRKAVPPNVAAALAKALEKLPADRFASAADFAAAINDHRFVGRTASGATAHGWSRSPSRAMTMIGAAAFLVAGAVLGAVLMRSRGAPGIRGSAPPVRAAIALPPDAPLALATLPPVGFNGPQVSLAPDGSMVAYIAATGAGNLVYVRDIATGETRPLAGTEGAKIAVFSPDGAWIAFSTASHIKKVPRAGGAVTELGAATSVRAWWPEPDFVYFDAQIGLLSRVSADGGMPEPVATATDFKANNFSDVLPGGKRVLLDARTASISGAYGDVVFADLATGRTTTVVRAGYAARYVPSGHLVFMRAGGLFGVPFDPDRGVVSGDPVAIASGVATESAFGMVQASASGGVLAYVPGTDVSRGKLAWVDRRGRVDFIDAPELVYGEVDLSPDDRHIAVHVADVQDYIFVWDLERHEGQRVAYPEAEGSPRWSADGRRLAGLVLGKGRIALHEVDDAGHVGQGTLLPGSAMGPDYFSPGGDVLAVLVSTAPFRTGFLALRPGASTPPGLEGALATFSPDGRWIAYTSADRGVPEIVVRSFPDGRDVGKVSPSGGIEPRWKPSGVLYYRNGHRWYETKVTTSPEPRWEPPQPAFDVEFIDTQGWSYDVSRDGQRLLVVKGDRPLETSRIELVTNWTTLLGRRQ